ncbi:hypothetical protein L9F63_023156, partial [Diploptera punctata]
LGQLSDNTPPIMYLDRKWVIKDTTPLGETVSLVKAEDSEMDRLVYGLEPKLNGDNPPAKPLPFVINNNTGVVKVNDSLLHRASNYKPW